ncbi:hypothetical protein EVAR_37170_1 [Eumeta japonica]|uniref:Uncharacterized protein n=1 Tax=Eumeta variegata TaxID=151549 RepID=A0A4C1WJ26_EUMVA|nr:hypothetical protein EVAR_37170_1 [Eumeta japonica]
MVIAAHEHSQPQKRHQRVAGILGRDWRFVGETVANESDGTDLKSCLRMNCLVLWTAVTLTVPCIVTASVITMLASTPLHKRPMKTFYDDLHRSGERLSRKRLAAHAHAPRPSRDPSRGGTLAVSGAVGRRTVANKNGLKRISTASSAP